MAQAEYLPRRRPEAIGDPQDRSFQDFEVDPDELIGGKTVRGIREAIDRYNPKIYGQGYGPDFLQAEDFIDAPKSKLGVGLSLAAALPGGRIAKGVANVAKSAKAAQAARAVRKVSQEVGKEAEAAEALEKAKRIAKIADIYPQGKAIVIPGESQALVQKPKAPAIMKGVTPEAIIEKAAVEKKKGPGFSKFAEGEGKGTGRQMFGMDKAPAERALPNRIFQPRRYDPPQGVSERMANAIADPGVMRQLESWVEAGKKMMPESWYRTSPLFEKYKSLYGNEKDALAAFQRYLNFMAAGSAQSSVPENIRTAAYYAYLASQGKPFPQTGPPPGLGHLAWQTHLGSANRIMNQGGLNPLGQPKSYSFVENLLGNERPVTIDRHNMRAISIAAQDPEFLARSVGQKPNIQRPYGMYKKRKFDLEDVNPNWWSDAPRDNEYKAYEKVQQQAARKMGITPADWQGWMWVGAGKKTGLESPPEPFLETLGNRIAFTAHRMGVAPDVILEKFVKGEIPLLSAGAGAAAAGAALPGKKEEQKEGY